jgi:hypothetical protein
MDGIVLNEDQLRLVLRLVVDTIDTGRMAGMPDTGGWPVPDNLESLRAHIIVSPERPFDADELQTIDFMLGILVSEGRELTDIRMAQQLRKQIEPYRR